MTGITTSPVTPGIPTTTPMVIEVNIGTIMEQAKRLSVAVNEVGENNMRHMGAVSLAVDVVGSEYYDHLHEMTTTSLQRIQASLRAIHQQMTAYTSTMGPNATEFHRVKADVAAAIELADLYLSPTPIPQHLSPHGHATERRHTIVRHPGCTNETIYTGPERYHTV